MNKIAFISDVHGNLPALQTTLSDVDAHGINNVYCLGDLVGYYCQINEVIDLIRSRRIPCILGNHDYALVNNAGIIERSKTCTKILTRQLNYITKSNLIFLQSLPSEMMIESSYGRIFCVHGGLNDHIDEYLSELNDDYFCNLDKAIKYVVTAHNHIAKVSQYENIVYANPGSVGQPRDHDPRASWLLFNNGNFEIKRVQYDIEATRQAMQKNGFEDYISDILFKGYRIGE